MLTLIGIAAVFIFTVVLTVVAQTIIILIVGILGILIGLGVGRITWKSSRSHPQ